MKISDEILDRKIKERLKVENSFIPQNINEVFDKSIIKIRKRKYLKLQRE